MKIISVILLFMVSPNAFSAQKIKLGWQVPWTIQGQIVQILKHTDILKRNELEVEFVGRTFGPELNELALAGSVDVIFTADQPAAILFSKTNDWNAIARLMYNRTSTYVPTESPIHSVADLKGKTIGLPFGAAAERIIHKALAEQKISDVHFINLGILEHAPLIKSAPKNAKQWGQFDALSGFDPIPAILESEGHLRAIHSGKVCAMVLVKKEMAQKDPLVMKKLLRSIQEAYGYYRKHKSQVNAWFLEEAKMTNVNKNALTITEALEPNLKTGTTRLSFTEDDFALMQEGADFATKATGKKIEMRNFVTNEFTKTLEP